MIRSMRPPGTAKQLHKRRLRAIKLRRAGQGLTAIARLTGAHRSSICRWRTQYQHQGLAGLKPRPVPGRPSKLSRQQRQHLQHLLLEGAPAHHFLDDYWTLQRIRQLIWKHFHVRYETSAISYLMNRLHWSCQIPQPQAMQRNASAIAQWKRSVWPQIKKRMDARRPPCFPGRKWLLPEAAPPSHLGPKRQDAESARQPRTGQSEHHQHADRLPSASPHHDSCAAVLRHDLRHRSHRLSARLAPSHSWPHRSAMG